MKRWLGVLGLVLAGLLQLGCGEEAITSPDACPPVALVDIQLTSTFGSVASLNVGDSGRFDLSPLDVNGNPLPRICHAATASWSVRPTTAGEFYGQTTSYQVFFRALAPGPALVIARSGAIVGEFQLDIQP